MTYGAIIQTVDGDGRTFIIIIIIVVVFNTLRRQQTVSKQQQFATDKEQL